MEQPITYYVPSIAISGISFYTGDLFPKWKNNLFVGSLGRGRTAANGIEGRSRG